MWTSREMHRDSAPAGDKACNHFTRQRIATVREPDQHVADAGNDHRIVGTVPIFARRTLAISTGWNRGLLAPVFLQLLRRQYLGQKLDWSNNPVADGGQQTVDVTLRKFLQRRFEPTLGLELGDTQVEPLQLGVEQRDA